MLGAGLRGLVSDTSNSKRWDDASRGVAGVGRVLDGLGVHAGDDVGHGVAGVGRALGHVGESIENSMGMTLLFAVIICSIIGFFIGYLIDKTKAQQTK